MKKSSSIVEDNDKKINYYKQEDKQSKLNKPLILNKSNEHQFKQEDESNVNKV